MRMILFKLLIRSYRRRFINNNELTRIIVLLSSRVPGFIALSAYDMRDVYDDEDDEALDIQENMLGGFPDDYTHMLN